MVLSFVFQVELVAIGSTEGCKVIVSRSLEWECDIQTIEGGFWDCLWDLMKDAI